MTYDSNNFKLCPPSFLIFVPRGFLCRIKFCVARGALGGPWNYRPIVRNYYTNNYVRVFARRSETIIGNLVQGEVGNIPKFGWNRSGVDVLKISTEYIAIASL